MSSSPTGRLIKATYFELTMQAEEICRLGRWASGARPRSSAAPRCSLQKPLTFHTDLACAALKETQVDDATLERGRAPLAPLPNLQIFLGLNCQFNLECRRILRE